MFFFFFLCFFSDQCCRDLFFPHAGSSNPHLSTKPHPLSLASPTTTIASFAGMQVKICFFFLFFGPMLQSPSLPHPPGPQTPASPPHNPYPHVPPLNPRKSPLPSPRRTQAITSASPLCHMQVCWHHPVTVRKTRHDTASMLSQHGMQAQLRRQPTPRKPCHVPPQCGVQVLPGANLPHTSPATACKPHHDPNLPHENLATSTQRASPAPPTHCA